MFHSFIFIKIINGFRSALAVLLFDVSGYSASEQSRLIRYKIEMLPKSLPNHKLDAYLFVY